MFERIMAILVPLQARVEWILRTLRKLLEWQRNVEQRIRELSGQFPGQNAVQFEGWANGMHATAKVTSVGGITKATSATAPGQGTIQLYLSFNPATPALSNLTGFDEPCFSINQDKAVNQNATVEVIRKYASWWVIMPDSCSHLT